MAKIKHEEANFPIPLLLRGLAAPSATAAGSPSSHPRRTSSIAFITHSTIFAIAVLRLIVRAAFIAVGHIFCASSTRSLLFLGCQFAAHLALISRRKL